MKTVSLVAGGLMAAACWGCVSDGAALEASHPAQVEPAVGAMRCRPADPCLHEASHPLLATDVIETIEVEGLPDVTVDVVAVLGPSLSDPTAEDSRVRSFTFVCDWKHGPVTMERTVAHGVVGSDDDEPLRDLATALSPTAARMQACFYVNGEAKAAEFDTLPTLEVSLAPGQGLTWGEVACEHSLELSLWNGRVDPPRD